MKTLGLCLIYTFALLTVCVGCAQFAQVDRAVVNKPAMSLNSPPFAKNQSTLTNQKSSSSVSIGSCSVCAH